MEVRQEGTIAARIPPISQPTVGAMHSVDIRQEQYDALHQRCHSMVLAADKKRLHGKELGENAEERR